MARQRKLTPERKAFINSLLEHYREQNSPNMQTITRHNQIFNYFFGILIFFYYFMVLWQETVKNFV